MLKSLSYSEFLHESKHKHSMLTFKEMDAWISSVYKLRKDLETEIPDTRVISGVYRDKRKAQDAIKSFEKHFGEGKAIYKIWGISGFAKDKPKEIKTQLYDPADVYLFIKKNPKGNYSIRIQAILPDDAEFAEWMHKQGGLD